MTKIRKNQNLYLFLYLFLISALSIFTLACPGKNNPSSPQSSAPTDTPTCNGTCPPTPTYTRTITPTPTNTPSCTGYTDVTSNIDGADINGDDTTSTPALINFEGFGPHGTVYTFTLTSPKVLNFSLCPTEDGNRSTFLAVRSSCWNPGTDLASNSGYCDNLSEVVGLSLPSGTYYLVMGDSPSAPTSLGPYVLRIKSGNLPSVVATVSPTSTPQAVPSGTYSSCTSPYDLNGGSQVGTADRVATGQIDDTTNTDDFYSFTPSHSGSVTVTLDSFDNGMNTADFDIYGDSNCPLGGTGWSSSGVTPVEQFTFTATAHTTYYVDVNAYFGSGSYRLTVRTP